jgi:hypothetical protein
MLKVNNNIKQINLLKVKTSPSEKKDKKLEKDKSF